MEPSEKIAQQLPSKEILQNYGRSSKLLIAAKDIPDLQFNVGKTESGSEFREHLENSLEGTGEVVEVMETEVSFQTVSDKFSVMPQDSDYREHSQNSLDNAAGVTLELLMLKEAVQVHHNTKDQETSSEYRECSHNLWSSGVCVAAELMKETAAERIYGVGLVKDSKYRECSQNSRVS